MKKKHKRILIGIVAFIPIICIALSLIIGTLSLKFITNSNDSSSFLVTLATISNVLMSIGIAFAIFDVIGFFLYNALNSNISHDKKVGWGYMLILINIIAIPAYWYNFIWKKRH